MPSVRASERVRGVPEGSRFMLSESGSARVARGQGARGVAEVLVNRALDRMGIAVALQIVGPVRGRHCFGRGI